MYVLMSEKIPMSSLAGKFRATAFHATYPDKHYTSTLFNNK